MEAPTQSLRPLNECMEGEIAFVRPSYSIFGEYFNKIKDLEQRVDAVFQRIDQPVNEPTSLKEKFFELLKSNYTKASFALVQRGINQLVGQLQPEAPGELTPEQTHLILVEALRVNAKTRYVAEILTDMANKEKGINETADQGKLEKLKRKYSLLLPRQNFTEVFDETIGVNQSHFLGYRLFINISKMSDKARFVLAKTIENSQKLSRNQKETFFGHLGYWETRGTDLIKEDFKSIRSKFQEGAQFLIDGKIEEERIVLSVLEEIFSEITRLERIIESTGSIKVVSVMETIMAMLDGKKPKQLSEAFNDAEFHLELEAAKKEIQNSKPQDKK